MKKSMMIWILCALFLCAGCDGKITDEEATTETVNIVDLSTEAEGVMNYEEICGMENGAAVVFDAQIEKVSERDEGYADIDVKDENGSYRAEDVYCTLSFYNKLKTGTRVRVTGFKEETDGILRILEAEIELLN